MIYLVNEAKKIIKDTLKMILKKALAFAPSLLAGSQLGLGRSSSPPGSSLGRRSQVRQLPTMILDRPAHFQSPPDVQRDELGQGGVGEWKLALRWAVPTMGVPPGYPPRPSGASDVFTFSLLPAKCVLF